MTTLFLAAGSAANCELLGIQGQQPVASIVARAMRLGFPSTGPIGRCRGRFCRGRSVEPLCAGQSTNQGSVGDWISRPKRKVPQMRRNRVFKCVATTGLLSVFLTANFAMARNNDDKKDRSNQGGRSSSNSGKWQQSDRRPRGSMSSSNDSSRSFSWRSSQSIQIPSSDRSTRSFGSGNGSVAPRSAEKHSAAPAVARRTTSRRPLARPVVKRWHARSMGPLPAATQGDGGSSFQGSSKGNTSGGNSGNSDNNSPRSFKGGS